MAHFAPGIRLFACFESCKLSAYIADSTQIAENERNTTSIWDLVNVEWLSKVKSIIEKSVDAPKSIEKLHTVLDLWRRATAGYLVFRLSGAGGCQELPVWLSEEAASEIVQVENRMAAKRKNGDRIGSLGRFWFCDSSELADLDPFTAMDLARESGVQESGDGVDAVESFGQSRTADRIRRETSAAVSLPESGSVIELNRSVRTFGGFVNPGAAVVGSSYFDWLGSPYVNLEREGRLVVSGMEWKQG